MPGAHNEDEAEIIRGRVPIPDPTRLTTEQLDKESHAIRELFRAHLRVIEQRFEGMDHALILSREVVDRHVDIAVGQSQQLFLERLAGIDSKIRDRDHSLASALQSAKEQAQERQASINKSLDQLNELMKTTTNAINSKVDENRERITMIESRSKGGSEVWGWIAAGVGMIWGLVTTFELLTHLGK